MEELKHVIALLLEDAKRLQQIEPNAGTEARIWLAMQTLSEKSVTNSGRPEFVEGADTSDGILVEIPPVNNAARDISMRERIAIAKVQLHMIESDLE
jgi:hypothetical protein